MDISGLGASKLLEALEKLGVSKGAELRSLGPQGEPPAEPVLHELHDESHAT